MGINNTKDRVPYVSISCIAYNHGLYIRQCIEGFLSQKTTFPIEILIHDDASTDNTVQIIKEFELKFPEIIKPIYQQENQYSKGVSISKTFNFPRSKGKYIAICEGDDCWTDPYKLQKQVNFLDANSDYGLTYTDIDRIDGQNNIIDKSSFKNVLGIHTNTFNDFLINAWFLAPCTWVFRKELIDYSVKVLLGPGDYQLLLQLSQKSKVYFFPETTVSYRVLDESASHFVSKRKSYFFRKNVFEIQLFFANNYMPESIEQIKIKFYTDFYFDICEFEEIKFIDNSFQFLRENGKISLMHKLYYWSRKIRMFPLLKRATRIASYIKKKVKK